MESSDQFVHAKVGTGDDCLNLVAMYVAPTTSKRSSLWGKLREVVGRIVSLLVMGGDFNTIVRLDERIGGNGRLSPDSLGFGEWVNDLSFIHLGFKGGRYKWKQGRVETARPCVLFCTGSSEMARNRGISSSIFIFGSCSALSATLSET